MTRWPKEGILKRSTTDLVKNYTYTFAIAAVNSVRKRLLHLVDLVVAKDI